MKHTCGGPKWGKLAPIGECVRCDELRNGAESKKGWGYNKKQQDVRLSQAIREHDCKKSGCMSVCVAFDW